MWVAFSALRSLRFLLCSFFTPGRVNLIDYATFIKSEVGDTHVFYNSIILFQSLLWKQLEPVWKKSSSPHLHILVCAALPTVQCYIFMYPTVLPRFVYPSFSRWRSVCRLPVWFLSDAFILAPAPILQLLLLLVFRATNSNTHCLLHLWVWGQKGEQEYESGLLSRIPALSYWVGGSTVLVRQ